MKEYKKHKFKFNPYLEKLYQSDEPLIIYKVDQGYNIYTHFSKKVILTNKNISKKKEIISNDKINVSIANIKKLKKAKIRVI